MFEKLEIEFKDFLYEVFDYFDLDEILWEKNLDGDLYKWSDDFYEYNETQNMRFGGSKKEWMESLSHDAVIEVVYSMRDECKSIQDFFVYVDDEPAYFYDEQPDNADILVYSFSKDKIVFEIVKKSFYESNKDTYTLLLPDMKEEQ